jgi:hypothetical protein
MTDLYLRRQRTFGSTNAEVVYQLSNYNILERDHSPRKYAGSTAKEKYACTYRASLREVAYIQ